MGKSILNLWQRVRTYFKTVNNDKKYLSSKQPDSDKVYSAVIYGASTKVGKAYAKFLGNHGFNLILVERERASLDDL